MSLEMNKSGLLAAAMYAILEDRLANERIVSFSVLVDNIISGYIQDDDIRRDFVIDLVTDSNTIKVEISHMTVLYPLNKQAIARIDIDDVKGPVEVDFERRRIIFKRVRTLSTKDVAWGWVAVKGTALDIIGLILK